MKIGKLGVWYFLDGMPATAAAEAAKRIESLGYSALWIPETIGRHPFVHASWLLANTESLIVATGIANIYHREPGVTLAAQNTLNEQSGGRFLLLSFVEVGSYARANRDVAHELGIPLLVYREPRLDIVHPTAEGNRTFARRILAELTEGGYLPEAADLVPAS